MSPANPRASTPRLPTTADASAYVTADASTNVTGSAGVSRGQATEVQPRKRVRLSREERIEQIIEAGTRLIGENGFYGLSLQQVADEVGLTQAGLLHYVHSKEGMLQLIIEQRYDRRFDPEDYIETGDPLATHPDGASFPGYLRYLVENNAKDEQLIRLYMVLGTESTSPEHPAHAYFNNRPSTVWELYARTAWRIPPSLGSFKDIRPLVDMALQSMDGLQLRFLRAPRIELTEAWAEFESVLFPSPLWDGFK